MCERLTDSELSALLGRSGMIRVKASSLVMKKLVGDKRVQLLPVSWRSEFFWYARSIIQQLKEAK